LLIHLFKRLPLLGVSMAMTTVPYISSASKQCINKTQTPLT